MKYRTYFTGSCIIEASSREEASKKFYEQNIINPINEPICYIYRTEQLDTPKSSGFMIMQDSYGQIYTRDIEE